MKKLLLALLITCSVSSLESSSCVQLLKTNSYNVLRHSYHLLKHHPYVSGITAVAILGFIYWRLIQVDYEND